MKCLLRYHWVKLPRASLPQGKGVMGHWAKLASRAAFRPGTGKYCGHINRVSAGAWAGGMVGLKSILGVKSREKAQSILNELSDLGYISYNLDPQTKKLTFSILDWVAACAADQFLLSFTCLWCPRKDGYAAGRSCGSHASGTGLTAMPAVRAGLRCPSPRPSGTRVRDGNGSGAGAPPPLPKEVPR